nr:Chain A, PaDBS1R3 [Pyrobaculum aerophilum str. IM2]
PMAKLLPRIKKKILAAAFK